MSSAVEHLYSQYKVMRSLLEAKILESKGDLGLIGELDSVYKKVLVLAAASQFENEITAVLLTSISKRTVDNKPLGCLLGSAFNPQTYYRLYKWKNKNSIQEFFEPFGEEFTQWYADQIKKNQDFNNSAACFVELSKLRNEVAHKNFAEYEGLKNKTADEIYEKYSISLLFLREIKTLID